MNALIALLPTLPGVGPVQPTDGTREVADLFAAMLAGQLTAPPPTPPAAFPTTPAFEADAALPPSAARPDNATLFDGAMDTPDASFEALQRSGYTGPSPATGEPLDPAAANRPVTASPVASADRMAATAPAADPVPRPLGATLPIDDGQPQPTASAPVDLPKANLGATALPTAAGALPAWPAERIATRTGMAERIQPALRAGATTASGAAVADDQGVAASPRSDRTTAGTAPEPWPRSTPEPRPELRGGPRPDQAPSSVAAPAELRAASTAGHSEPAMDLQIQPTIEAREGPIATRSERAFIETPAPVRTPNPPPALQIGLQIVKAATQQVERLLVQLEPAELGRVEVRLEFGQESRVSAIIAAERPETLDALQRDVRLLERGLQDAGLRLEGNGLSFSLKHEQSQGDGRHFGEHAADAGADPAERGSPRTEDTTQSAPEWRSAGLRLLDIQA